MYMYVHVRYASKRMQQLVIICAALFDKKMCYTFYGLPLDLCGKHRDRNCGAFCPTCCNSVNAPHFHGKRRCTAVRPSECGAHGGRKVVHITPCFQVPLRCVFVALFLTRTAYRMCFPLYTGTSRQCALYPLT